MRMFPSKYIRPLYTSTAYEVDVFGGRGRGGSHGLTEHALFNMIKSAYFRGYFVRAIQGTIRDSLWLDFKDRINEVSELNKFDLNKFFKLNENDMSATYLPNGNTIKAKGFRASSKSNTANMKSLANATNIYIEECEEVGELEYNKLADSLRTIKAPIQIVRSWNVPPKDHWLIKNYYNLEPSGVKGFERLVPKGNKDHLSLFGTYKDNWLNINPKTASKYKGYKERNPRYYYNQIMGFCSDGGDKRVYYGWQAVSDEEFDSIDGVEAYGVDFGDVAPTTLVHVKFKDGRFYRKELLYKSLRELSLIYKKDIKVSKTASEEERAEQYNIWLKHKGLLPYIFNLKKVDKNIPMFCDPAQKDLIIELRRAGFNAVKANKNVSASINFINRAENYYTKNSLNLEEEYNGYYLQTDINKNPIDGKPISINNHLMNAQEYGVIGLRDTYQIIL